MSSPSQSYFSEINRLRAVAVIFVLFNHFIFIFAALGMQVPTSLSHTWGGVDLFFVISGFLVTRILIQNFNSTGIIRFYARRAFRILPVCFLWLILITLLTFYFNTKGSFGERAVLTREILGVLTFSYNQVVVHSPDVMTYLYHWSLSIEEQFYVLFPLLLLIVRKNQSRIVLCILGILLEVFFIRPLGITPEMPAYIIHNASYFRFDSILAGCLLNFWSSVKAKSIRNRSKDSSLFRKLTWPLLLSVAFIPGMFEIPSDRYIFGLPIVIVASVILVFLASKNQGIILGGEGPVQRMLDGIGHRSYSIYLCHFPLLLLIQEVCMRWIFQGPILITPLFCIAYIGASLLLIALATELTHQWVEKPIINFGKKWV